VVRLEAQYDRLDGKVDDIAVQMARLLSDQGHLGQLVVTQHQAITAEVQLLRGRVTSVADLMKDNQAEPESTPAGRAIMRMLDLNRKTAEKVHTDLSDAVSRVADESRQNRIWIAAASAIVGVVILVLNIFAPAVRVALGLP
jgi:CHASE3 domain sensor protein